MNLLNRYEAALLVGVDPNTIQTWRQRGLLVPRMRGPHGVLLYRPSDVLWAERSTRRKDPARRRARRLAREASRE
jgi:DNA-binding transcriptional MerR regulator